MGTSVHMYIRTEYCRHGQLTTDSAVGASGSVTLCEGDAEGLERGAGRGGLLVTGTAGAGCCGPRFSKILRLLATDSECSAAGFGALAAGSVTRVLFETTDRAVVGAGGSFRPVGVLALL